MEKKLTKKSILLLVTGLVLLGLGFGTVTTAVETAVNPLTASAKRRKHHKKRSHKRRKASKRHKKATKKHKSKKFKVTYADDQDNNWTAPDNSLPQEEYQNRFENEFIKDLNQKRAAIGKSELQKGNNILQQIADMRLVDLLNGPLSHYKNGKLANREYAKQLGLSNPNEVMECAASGANNFEKVKTPEGDARAELDYYLYHDEDSNNLHRDTLLSQGIYSNTAQYNQISVSADTHSATSAVEIY